MRQSRYHGYPGQGYQTPKQNSRYCPFLHHTSLKPLRLTQEFEYDKSTLVPYSNEVLNIDNPPTVMFNPYPYLYPVIAGKPPVFESLKLFLASLSTTTLDLDVPLIRQFDVFLAIQ